MMSSIVKLTGRDNYSDWQFEVEAYLKHEELWTFITSASDSALSAADTIKEQKAQSKIIMLVDRSLYTHIKKATSAKEMWTSLKTLFEDKGVVRRSALLRQLIDVRLSKCDSMQEYVNTIVDTAHKLHSAGFDIPDEMVGSIMLAGLTPDFRPMLMAFENSGLEITGDSVKTRLLQEEKSVSVEAEVALASKFQHRNHKKKQFDKSKVRCHNCNQYGHFKSECVSKPKEKALLTSFVAREPLESDDWFIDSGASGHMTMRNDLMVATRTASNTEVIVADNSRLKVNYVGDVRLTVMNGKSIESVLIQNVQYVPKICANLLSVSQMMRQGHIVKFEHNKCEIFDKSKTVIATATMHNNMFKLDRAPVSQCYSANTDNHSNNILWHRRFGHASHDKIRKLSTELADGIVLAPKVQADPCEICLKGKQSRKPFREGSRAKGLLGIIHSDLCGPLQVASLGGAVYFQLFIDDFSRMTFVYFLKKKSEATDCFINFKQFVENQTDKKIKIFRSDNGGEFENNRMINILERNGIWNQTSTPHTPESNGLAERMNRSVVEKARCMLFDSKLSLELWAEAVSTAVYLINRLPSAGTGRTPYEIWHGTKPNLSALRIFGCKAMAHVPKANRRKLDAKSTTCALVGYSAKSKAYRLFNLVTKKIIVSRDVVFLENEMAANEVIHKTNQLNNLFLFTSDEVILPEASTIANNANSTEEITEEITEEVSTPEESSLSINVNIDDSVVAQSDATIINTPAASSSTTAPYNATRPIRQRPPAKVSIGSIGSFESFESSLQSSGEEYEPSTDIPSTDDSNSTVFESFFDELNPRTELIEISSDTDDSSNSQERTAFSFAAKSAEVGDPISMKAALSRADSNFWKLAMKEEYDSLIENGTWELVDLPLNRKPIDCKWVYKTKRNDSGSITRHKARLVIKGCAQRPGIDYAETYAPVVRYTSIRYLLAIAAKHNLQIDQMDAVSAFLQGEIDDVIYMLQPQGFSDGTNKVCRLKKSLYGLKQASRVWNAKLNSALIKFGLQRSKLDPCIYYRQWKDTIIILAIYVDDILLLSNNEQAKLNLKAKLSTTFKMKDLGAATSVLGMNITRDWNDGTISIDQSRYITEVLERFGMQDSHPVTSPMDVNVKLSKSASTDSDRLKTTAIPYQEAVGCLLYVAQVSRPDICFALSVVSRFNHNPAKIHWQAVKRIMRYLKGTLNAKLVYRRDGNSELTGYCDADHAGDMDDGKSTTGYVFMLSDSAISWNSRKQPTVALSTTEAEYMALSAASQEAIWLRNLHMELFECTNEVHLFCDSGSALELARNDMYHARTKHINIKFHFIRESIKNNIVRVSYINTNDQIADVLTKSLVPIKHKYFIEKFGILFPKN